MKFNELPASHKEQWAESMAITLKTTRELASARLKAVNPHVIRYANGECSTWESEKERKRFYNSLTKI